MNQQMTQRLITAVESGDMTEIKSIIKSTTRKVQLTRGMPFDQQYRAYLTKEERDFYAVNSKLDGTQLTALHMACFKYGQATTNTERATFEAIVKYLLERGATPGLQANINGHRVNCIEICHGNLPPSLQTQLSERADKGFQRFMDNISKRNRAKGYGICERDYANRLSGMFNGVC